jgi:2-hydroxy-3-keto-5-methylthiopentenyl-1-phosphate phosphatase
MSIKIKQKLGKESFAKLQEQLKTKGVKVIVSNKDGFITSDDVIGKVTSVFNLGQKLDVYADVRDKDKNGTEFKFAKIQDDFYLMQGEVH